MAVANETESPFVDPIPTDPAEVCTKALDSLDCWIAENTYLARLLLTVIVFVVAWAMVKLGDRALTQSAERLARLRHADEYKTKVLVGRTKPMKLTLRLMVIVVGGLTLLGVWGIWTAFSGLLAGAGFAGIVIGLAAADTIGDVIAGFLIFYNHPFDIGDWVEIDGVQGTVSDVQLGATTLITFDNEKVTIPNRIVEGQKIKNFSHASKLRRRLVVGVEYGTNLEQAMETLLELAKAHPDVHNDPEPSCVSSGFGDSSVNLELRFWVDPVRTTAIKTYTDLVRHTHDTFRERGLGIAFPHMQIVQSKPWNLQSGHEDI